MKTFAAIIPPILLISSLLASPARAFAAEEPILNSQSAVLMDAKSGKVLYEKKGKEKMYPASLTKIVTAMVAIESGKLEEAATVSEKASRQEPSKLNLASGEKKTVRELTWGLLMKSGNDAAMAIAEHVGGSQEGFAEAMNAFMKKRIGENDSHFSNPSGLFDKQNYTTAYDLARVAKYALQYPLFEKIISAKSMRWKGAAWEGDLPNQHPLYGSYEGLLGGKTGFTEETGNTLISVAKRGDVELVAVNLKAAGKEKAASDAAKLLDYGFDRFETRKLLSKGDKITVPSGTFEAAEDISFTAAKGPIEVSVSPQGDVTIHSEGEERTLSAKLLFASSSEPEKAAPADSGIWRAARSMGAWTIALALLAIAALRFRKLRRGKLKVKISKPKHKFAKSGA